MFHLMADDHSCWSWEDQQIEYSKIKWCRPWNVNSRQRLQISNLEIFFTLLLLYLHYIATKILFLAIKGELLDVNFTHVYGRNKYRIMKNAKVFGLGWLGDRATIKRIPLLNMLVMCGEEVPVVVLECDFTEHMVDGKKMLSISWIF